MHHVRNEFAVPYSRDTLVNSINNHVIANSFQIFLILQREAVRNNAKLIINMIAKARLVDYQACLVLHLDVLVHSISFKYKFS